MAEGTKNTAPFRAGAPFRLVDVDDIPLEERSSEWLMLEHGKGSEEAFAVLVRRHQKGMLNYMYRMIQNRQVAEELTQEVFLALVKNARRYEPTAKFTTYLYAIASNIVSKEWVRRKRRLKLFDIGAFWNRNGRGAEEYDPLDSVSDERASVFKAFQRGEVSEAVNAALQELPAHQREAFVLRRCQDLSYEEVASVTNSPVGTVKSRIVRAERALRPLLARFEDYV